MALDDDHDVELPLKIVHNCMWFNPANNDDPYIESNFLYYEFGEEPEKIVVLMDLVNSLAAKIMWPELGNQPLPNAVKGYLWKRFDFVEQASGHGFTVLWRTRN